MADINVERRGPSIWPWIVGLLVLALLIWAIAEMLGRGDRAAAPVAEETLPAATTPAGTMPGATPAVAPAALQQFVSSCVQNGQLEMGTGHDFAVTCLRRLADATETVAQQQTTAVDVRTQLQQARQAADRIEQSPDAAVDHANHVRRGAEAIGQAIGQIQTASHPQQANHAQQAQQSAQAIQPAVPLLDQRAEVNRFFDHAASALRDLSGAAATGARP